MILSGVIFLKKGKSISLQRLHPWIFSGAIQKTEGHLTDGVWVEIRDDNNKTLGFGHYQNGSIAVRVISFGTVAPNEFLYDAKISNALALRSALGFPSEKTNCFRLIHGEGDGLSGLVVDFYNGHLVMQAHSAGMHADHILVVAALHRVLGDSLKSVYYKSQTTLPGKTEDGYLIGTGSPPHIVREYDHQFYIDWESGQKTGFFLDQRENRNLVGQFSKNRKVLNTFCYTGGFSVYALQAGAELVHSVDASEKAIELTRKNIALNDFDPTTHTCFAEDTFRFLSDKKDQYDLIILDPPAFAKHRDAKHQAIKGYQRLNTEALRAIRKGGILFTFSCSQIIDTPLFYNTVVSSCIQAHREIKILHRLHQPADHPVSAFHPEGEYLKGLVLLVK